MRTPRLDSLEYYEWARLLSTGDFVWPAAFPHGPGYPLFLGAFLAVFDHSLLAARIVQAAAGALSCWLIFLLARRFYAWKAALAAGLMAALYGPLILTDISILAEGLLILLILGSVWLTLSSEGRTWRIVAGAILLGCAITVRPTAAVVAPVLLLWTWKVSGRRLVMPAVFAIAMLLPVAPVTAINWQNTGAFIPVQARGGLNFYYGISPERTGIADSRLGGPWETLANEGIRHGYSGPDEDQYYVKKAVREILAKPVQFLRLLASKAVWSVQNVEIRDSHSFYFFESHSRLLTATLPFAVLFGFAAGGVVAGVRRRLTIWPFVSLCVLFEATLILLLVGSRYRLPIVPFLAVLGGLGVASLIDLARARRPAFAALATIVLLSGLLTLVRDHRPSRNLAEEWELTGEALVVEGRHAEARDAFQLALREDPRWVRALVGLAVLEHAGGNIRAAERLLDRAIRIDDRYPQSHEIRGDLARERRDFDAAIHHYREAVRLAPNDAEARTKLAEVLVATGNVSEAEEAYVQVLDLFERKLIVIPDADRARVWLRLAELRGASGRPLAAIEAAERSLAIEPANGRGWILLSMLALDAGEFSRARDAYHRATTLVPGDPLLRLLRTRLNSDGA